MQTIKRPIEFRAWHIPSGHLFSVLYFTESEVFYAQYDAYGRDKCILMQFTGLFDSQGQKVFEGDIIYSFYKGRDREPSTEFWRVVAFRDGCFCQLQSIDEEATVFNLEPMLGIDQDTVVGCYYARPDLLALNTETGEVPASFI